jgi:hypothetical protein
MVSKEKKMTEAKDVMGELERILDNEIDVDKWRGIIGKTEALTAILSLINERYVEKDVSIDRGMKMFDEGYRSIGEDFITRQEAYEKADKIASEVCGEFRGIYFGIMGGLRTAFGISEKGADR